MKRDLVVMACLAACSSRSAQPVREHGNLEQAGGALPIAAVHTVRIPIVPAPLVAKLGSARVILAIDGTRPSDFPVAELIPKDLACSRDLWRSAGVIVFLVSAADHLSLFATDVDIDALRACLPEWQRVAGVTSRDVDGTLTITIANLELAVTQHGTTLSVEEVGYPLVQRPATAAQRAVFERLPNDVGIWAFATGFPPVSVGVDTMAAWFTRTKAAAHVTIVATGEDAALEKSVGGLVRGMKKAATEKGMGFDESWLTMSATPGSATIDLTVPGELIDRLRTGR